MGNFQDYIESKMLKIAGERIELDRSKGIGRDTNIPWIRFHNSKTPSPRHGWSLNLFIHDDGKGVSLAISLGVYGGDNLKNTIKLTDTILNDSNIPAEYRIRPIVGRTSLGNGYRNGTPVSITWNSEEFQEISDQQFLKTFEEFILLLDYILKTYPMSSSISHWIIQYNPEIWDFERLINDDVKEFSFKIGNYKERVQVGDRVLVWRSGADSGIIALGTVIVSQEDGLPDEVTARYFVSDLNAETISTRIYVRIDDVFEPYVSKQSLRDILRENNIIKAPQSSSPFWMQKAEFDRIMSFTESSTVVPKRGTFDLAQELLIDELWLKTIESELKSKRQIIIQGPPGTGKTFIAQALARTIAERYAVVQFHPSYSYEDFIEGFRPSKLGDGLVFEVKPGPLVNLANEASNHPEKLFILVIDEINRGNLAKIFGELYFLLEYRNHDINMQYRDLSTTFSLPDNLLIIGTMNSADRSIAPLDMAIRRRFSFIELNPSIEPVKGLLLRWLQREELPTNLADVLDFINSEIQDKRFQLGPSYFMKRDIYENIENVWKFQVFPQLSDVLFDSHEILERLTFDAIKHRLP